MRRLQGAGVDQRPTGVGVRARERQCAGADFRQRAVCATAESAILHQPGKSRAHIVRAHGQINASEEDKTVALNRAGRDARSVVLANVQSAVAENPHPRRTTRAT